MSALKEGKKEEDRDVKQQEIKVQVLTEITVIFRFS